MLKKIFRKLRNEGLGSIGHYVKREILKTKSPHFSIITTHVAGKKGLEIGGPSRIFGAGGYLPVYAIARQVDGCNFTTTTVWEGTIAAGFNYSVGSHDVGYQFIADSVDLQGVTSSSYDFVLSSHSLEHIANPIKALKEWLRVLKPGGTLLLILPDRRYTFDRRRPVSTLAHLIEDYNAGTTESDLTHLDEILELHDIGRDEGAGSFEAFKERSLKNYENRCLHQHVFDLELVSEVFDHVGLEMIFKETAPPHHMIAMGIKKY